MKVNKFLKILDGNNKSNDKSLQLKLIHMLRDYFTLRVQLRLGKLKQIHLLKKLRRDIACIKFLESKNKSRLK